MHVRRWLHIRSVDFERLQTQGRELRFAQQAWERALSFVSTRTGIALQQAQPRGGGKQLLDNRRASECTALAVDGLPGAQLKQRGGVCSFARSTAGS